MITYEWNCKTVDCYIQSEGENDVIYNVHYIVTGISEQLDAEGNPYKSNFVGTQYLNIDDITDFIPFNEVTNTEVVQWTKTTMGVDEVAFIEQNIAYNIERQINPETITLEVTE